MKRTDIAMNNTTDRGRARIVAAFGLVASAIAFSAALGALPAAAYADEATTADASAVVASSDEGTQNVASTENDATETSASAATDETSQAAQTAETTLQAGDALTADTGGDQTSAVGATPPTGDTSPTKATADETSATYALTLEAQGGSLSTGETTAEYAQNATVVLPAATKDGYEFAGWNTAEDGSGTMYGAGATITITENATLYAIWKPVENSAEEADETAAAAHYNVTFDAAGGTVNGAASYAVEVEGSTSLSLPDAERDGYSFLGWAVNASAVTADYQSGDKIIVKSDVALTAKWAKIAIVMTASASAEMTTQAVTRTGYFRDTTGAKNTNLVWQYFVNAGSVTFIDKNGVSKTVAVPAKSIVFYAADARAGEANMKTWAGYDDNPTLPWLGDRASTSEGNTAAVVGTTWKNRATNNYGSLYTSGNILHIYGLNGIAPTTMRGWFAGYHVKYTAAAFAGATYNKVNSVQIADTYNADGSVDVYGMDLQYCTDIGEAFRGIDSCPVFDVGSWNTSKITKFDTCFLNMNLTGTYDLSNWDMTSATTYADFLGGDSGTAVSFTKLTLGNGVQLANMATSAKAGPFNAANTTTGGAWVATKVVGGDGSVKVGLSLNGAQLLSYYPNGGNSHGIVTWQWKTSASELYSVTLSANGGKFNNISSKPTTITYRCSRGGYILLPETGGGALYEPTYDGYKIDGWRIGGTRYDPGTLYQVNSNVTVNALWISKYNVQIRFMSNATTAPTYATYPVTGSVANVEDTPFSLVTLPTGGFTLPGYKLAGWSTAASNYKTGTGTSGTPGGTFRLPAPTAADNDGATYDAANTVWYLYMYAIWEPATYTINYDTDGGTPAMPSNTSVKWEDANLVPAASDNPSKLGYELDYWTYTKDGVEYRLYDTDIYYNIASSATTGTSVTLKAHWKEALLNITYRVNPSFVHGSFVPTSVDAGGTSYPIDGGTQVWIDKVQSFSGTAYGATASSDTGYHFIGWTNNITSAVFYDELLTGTQVRSVAFFGGIWHTATFTANYATNTYTIVYDNNAATAPWTGATGSIDSQLVAYGNSVTLATATGVLSCPGYTFKEWSTTPTGDAGAGAVLYQENTVQTNMSTTHNDVITLYAIWEEAMAHIVFKAATGGKLQKGVTTETTDYWDQEIGAAGGTLTDVVAVPATGYHFMHWLDKSGDIIAASVGDPTWMPTKPGVAWPLNDEYTAVFSANTYLVRYDRNGASYDSSYYTGQYPYDQTFTYGVTQMLTTVDDDPTTPGVKEGLWKEGYTFGGWEYMTWSIVNEADATDDTDKTYPIYGSDGTTVVGYNVKSTSKLANGKVVGSLTPEEYVGESVFTTDPDGSTHVTGVVSLKALWEPVTYTIRFMPNLSGTSGTMDDQKFEFDEEKQLTANAYTRNGYTFKGWATDAGTYTVTYTDEQSVKNLTNVKYDVIYLYAVWAKTMYDVTFEIAPDEFINADDTSLGLRAEFTQFFNGNPEQVEFEASVIKTPVHQTRSTGQFEFSYWHYKMVQDNGNVIEGDVPIDDISTLSILGTTTLTLHYNAKTYSVVYDPGEHGTFMTGVTDRTWFTNTDFDASLSGYTFGGSITSKSVTNADYGKFYDTAATNSKNVGKPKAEEGYRFLYWEWTINEGDDVTPNYVTYNSSADPFPATFRDARGSIVFRAVYEARSFTLSFNPNNGIDQKLALTDGTTALDTRTVPTGTTLVLTATDGTIMSLPNSTAVARAGYILDGWALAPDAAAAEYNLIDGFVMPGHSLTLYAHWRAKTYQIYYDTLGGSLVDFVGGYSGTNIMVNNLRSGVAWTQNGFITDVTEPTKPGYVFMGWYDTLGGGTDLAKISDSMPFEGIAPTKTDGSGEREDAAGTVATLYAKWVEADAVIYYVPAVAKDKDVYDSYSNPIGETEKTLVATTGGYVTLDKERVGAVTGMPDGSTAHANTGYKFMYWAVMAIVTADETYWDDVSASFKTRTVTRTVIDIVTESDGATPVGETLAPVKGIYNPYVGLYNIWEDGLTYYAVFSPISYTIHFSENGGAGNMDDQVAEYDESVTLARNVTLDPLTNLYTQLIYRAGYAFRGWNTAPDGTGASYSDGDTVINLASDDGAVVTLYAVWEEADQTVTFDPNCPEYSATTIPTYTGDILGVPAASAYPRDGYDLIGWCAAADGSGVVYAAGTSFNVPEYSLTLYAIWKPYSYTIVFLPGADEVTGTMPDQPMLYGTDQALTPNQYARAGYTFVGWTKTLGSTVADFTDSAVVSNLTTAAGGEVYLYAIWAPNVNRVTFVSGDTSRGTVVADPQWVLTDSYADSGVVGVFPVGKYTLVGWTYVMSLDDGTTTMGSVDDPATVKIKGETVFTALFGLPPMVIYLPGVHGGFVADVANATVFEGLSYGDQAPEYNGLTDYTGKPLGQGNYKFQYWLDQNGTRYNWGDDLPYLLDAEGSRYYIFTAVWYAEGTVTLVIDPDGASDAATWLGDPGTVGSSSDVSLVKEAGTTYNLPNASVMRRAGYSFDGWATSPTGPAVYPGDYALEVPDGSVTLYAHWSLRKYGLAFDTDGGTTVPTLGSVTWKQTGLIPADPTKAGYIFQGWLLTKGDTSSLLDLSVDPDPAFNVIAGGVELPVRTVWLYAWWVPEEATIYYVATTGGSVDSSSETVAAATTDPLNGSTATHDPGYHLVGWYDEDGNQVSSGETFVPTKASAHAWTTRTYTAKFEANTYTIRFNANGGSGSLDDMSMTYDVQKALTPVGSKITRPGYQFLGWATDPSATSITYADNAQVKNLTTENGTIVVLYAVWKNVGCRVYYNSNGGTGSVDPAYNGKVYLVDSTVTTVLGAGLSRVGYKLASWNTAANGTGTTVALGGTFTMPAHDVTLYAQWTPITYTLRFATGNANVTGNDPADSTYLADRTLTYVQSTVLPMPGWSLLGRQFDHWEINGASYSAGSSVKQLASTDGATVIAKAIWKAIPVSITWKTTDATKGTVAAANGATSIVWGNTLSGVGYSADSKPAYKATRNGEYYISGWKVEMDLPNGTLAVYSDDVADDPTDAALVGKNAVYGLQIRGDVVFSAIWSPSIRVSYWAGDHGDFTTYAYDGDTTSGDDENATWFRYLEPNDTTPAYQGAKDGEGDPLGLAHSDATGRMWLFNGWTAYASYDSATGTFSDPIGTYGYGDALPKVADNDNHAVFYVANWIESCIVKYKRGVHGAFGEGVADKTVFYAVRPGTSTPVYAGAFSYDGKPAGADGWQFKGWMNSSFTFIQSDYDLSSITVAGDALYIAKWAEPTGADPDPDPGNYDPSGPDDPSDPDPDDPDDPDPNNPYPDDPDPDDPNRTAWIIRYVYDTVNDSDKADFAMGVSGKTKFAHVPKSTDTVKSYTPAYAGAADSFGRPLAKSGSGYYFAGWVNKATGDTYYVWDLSDIEATADAIYTAMWWKYYSVTYDPGTNGDWAANVSGKTHFTDIERTTSYQTTHIPSFGAGDSTYFDAAGAPLGQVGYIWFDKWLAYASADGGTTWALIPDADLTAWSWDLTNWDLGTIEIDGATFPQDVKFVAQWKVATYTIEFDINAPSDAIAWSTAQDSPHTQEIMYGAATALDAVDTSLTSAFYRVNGYTWQGWLTDAGLAKWGTLENPSWASFVADSDNAGLWYGDQATYLVAIGDGATYDQVYKLHAVWDRNSYTVEILNISDAGDGSVWFDSSVDGAGTLTQNDIAFKGNVNTTGISFVAGTNKQLWGWFYHFELDDGTVVEGYTTGRNPALSDGLFDYTAIIEDLGGIAVVGDGYIQPVWDRVFDVVYSYENTANGGFTRGAPAQSTFYNQRRSLAVPQYAAETDGAGLPLGAPGYVFQYWYLAGNEDVRFSPADLVGLVVTDDFITNTLLMTLTDFDDLVLYARFAEADATVRFNWNVPPLSVGNATQPSYDQSVTFDTDYTLVANAFTANGYKFLGWVATDTQQVWTLSDWALYTASQEYYDDLGTIRLAAPSLEDTYGYVYNLYAAWTPLMYYVYIIDHDDYVAYGNVSGSDNYLSQGVFYGNPPDVGDIVVTVAAGQVHEHWGWGWHFELEDGTVSEGETEGALSDVIVLGNGNIWPIFRVLYYVRYLPDDAGIADFAAGEDGTEFKKAVGQDIPEFAHANSEVDAISSVTVPKATVPGYVFKGWKWEEQVTYYEVWVYDDEDITYSIETRTTDTLGAHEVLMGSWTDTVEHILYAHKTAYGDGVDLPITAMTGMKVPEGGIVFTALWAPEYVVLTFDPNGGTSYIDSDDYKMDDDGWWSYWMFRTPGEDSVERSGYTLVGWNTAYDGSGTTFALDTEYPMFDEDTTLYAMWQENIGSVYYSSHIYNKDEYAGSYIKDDSAGAQIVGLVSDAAWTGRPGVIVYDSIYGYVTVPAYGQRISAVNGWLVDASGNRIQAVDDDGNPVFDSYGNPVYQGLYSVTAVANYGYHFVHWIDSKGRIVSTNATYTAEADPDTGLFEDVVYWAVFSENDDVRIEYRVSNTDAGWVYRDYELVAPYTGEPQGTTVYAREGYRFLYWYYYDDLGNIVVVDNPQYDYKRQAQTGGIPSAAALSSNPNYSASGSNYMPADFKPYREENGDYNTINWTYSSRVYIAAFEGVAVKYTVQYWLQGVDGIYRQAGEDLYYNRKTGELVLLADNDHPLSDDPAYDADNARWYGAFEAPAINGYELDLLSSITTGTALSDGTLVLRLYYDRVKHTVSYEFRGEQVQATDSDGNLVYDGEGNPVMTYVLPTGIATLLPVPPSFQAYYGEQVQVEPVPSLSGYRFVWTLADGTEAAQWAIEGASYIPGTDIFSMPDNDVVLYGMWQPIGYLVEFTSDATFGTIADSRTSKYVDYNAAMEETGADGYDKVVVSQLDPTDDDAFVFYGWTYTMYDPDDDTTVIGTGFVVDPCDVIILGRTVFDANWAAPLVVAYFPGEHGTFTTNVYPKTMYPSLAATDLLRKYKYRGETETDASDPNYGNPTGDVGWTFRGWRWSTMVDTDSDGIVDTVKYYFSMPEITDATDSDQLTVVTGMINRLKLLYGVDYEHVLYSTLFDASSEQPVEYTHAMTAIWTAQKYHFIIDPNNGYFWNATGGTAVSSSDPGYSTYTMESNFDVEWKFNLPGFDWARRAGYVMDGFSLAPEGDPAYAIDYLLSSQFEMPAHDVTLYVHWSEAAPVSIVYVVSGNGTTSPNKEWVAPVTGTPTGSTATPNPGYKFWKWTDAAGNQVGDGTATLVPTLALIGADYWTDGTAFTAWFVEDDAVVITYKVEGAGGAVYDVGTTNQVSSTSESVLPISGTAQGTSAVAANGYEFDGWYLDGVKVTFTDGDGTVYDAPAGSFVPARVSGAYQAATYVAKFKPMEVDYFVKHYKVVRDGSGNTVVELIQLDTERGTVDTTATATPLSLSGYDPQTSYTITGPYIYRDSVTPAADVNMTGDGSELVKASGLVTADAAGYGTLILELYYRVTAQPLTIVVDPSLNETFGDGVTDTWSGDYAPSTIITLPASGQVKRAGYQLAGWSETQGATTGGVWSWTMGTSAVTLYPVWTANTNTPYTVHYVPRDKNGLGITSLTTTASFTGTTGDTVTAVAISIDGFTYNDADSTASKTGTIAGDGSLHLYLYYDANRQTVRFDENGGAWGDGTAAATKQFDEWTYEIITFPGATNTTDKVAGKVYRAGYTLLGWSLSSTATTATWAPGDSDHLPGFATTPGVIYAVWEALPNTPYTIRHIKVRADGTTVLSGDYLLVETGDNALATANGYTYNSALVGTTGATATATAQTFPGYTYMSGFNAGGLNYEQLTGTIAGDGSLILSIYYRADSVNYIVHHKKIGQDGTDRGTEDETVSGGEVGQLVTATPKTTADYPGWTHYLAWTTVPGGTTITGTEYGTIPASGTLELTVYYVANTGITYKVQHIKVGRDGTQRDLEEETFTDGEVGKTATATIKSYAGWVYYPTWDNSGTLSPALTSTTSAPVTVDASGTGDLVMKLYYVANTGVDYYIWHYKIAGDGTETLIDTMPSYTGETGEAVSIQTSQLKTYAGYTYDPSAPNAVSSGTITVSPAGIGTLVLKAYYRADSHTLTFHADGGTWTSGAGYGTGTSDWVLTAAVDTPFTTPGAAALTMSGYEVIGWATSQGSTTVFKNVDAAWAMPTANMDLWPIWHATNATLKFYAGTSAQIATVTGSGPADITAAVGATVNLPDKNTWVLLGYDFQGWSTTAGGAVMYGVSDPWTMLASGNDLYAIWAPATVTYTVKHIRVRSDGTPTTDVLDTETPTGTVGTTVTATPQTFNGYTYTPNFAYPAGTVLEVASGTVLIDGTGAGTTELRLYYTAMQVTYVVNYIKLSGDGSAVRGTESETGPATDVGETVTAGPKTYTGYTQVATLGSYTTNDSGVVTADASGNGTLVLNVYFQAQNVTYTVKHIKVIEQIDGTETRNVEETESITAEVDSVATATPKAYTSFTLDPTDAAYLATGTVAGDSSTELTLVYDADKFTVTMYPYTPAKASTWATAGWAAPDGTTMTGNTPWTYNVSFGADLPLPATTDLEFVGYVFKGFDTSSTGASVFTTFTAGNTVTMPNSAIDLYPVWEAAPQVIVFIGGDAAALSDPDWPVTGSNQSQGDPTRADVADAAIVTGYSWTVTDNDNPGFVRQGYEFKGWVAPDGTLYQVGDTFVVGPTDADNELTAKWEEKEFTVEYWGKHNGSSAIVLMLTKTYRWTESGMNLTKADLAAEGVIYTGYKLNTWSTKKNNKGTKLTDSMTYADLMTALGKDDSTTSQIVYANWGVITVTFTYESANSTYVAPAGYAWNSSGFDSPLPVRVGYQLVGWYTKKNKKGTKLTADMTVAQLYEKLGYDDTKTDITVYATWSAIKYTVQFDSQGGTPVSTPQQTWDSSNFVSAVPTLAGYTFDGWYTEPLGAGALVTSSTKISDLLSTDDNSLPIKLYACWRDALGAIVDPTA